MLDAAIAKVVAVASVRSTVLAVAARRLRAALLAQLLFLLFVPVAVVLALIHHLERQPTEKVEAIAIAEDKDDSSKTLDERVRDLLLSLSLDEESATMMATRVQRGYRRSTMARRPRMSTLVLESRVDSFLATVDNDESIDDASRVADEDADGGSAAEADEAVAVAADHGEALAADEAGIADETGLSQPPPRANRMSTKSLDKYVDAFLHDDDGEGGKGETGEMAPPPAEPTAVMSADELAQRDAEDLAKKQAEAAKKAKEKEELEAKNAARDAELAKSGKRAAGGMHKFDPDEVDVHGGNATADDFMDAFGF